MKRNDIRAINGLEENHYDRIPDLATEFSLVKIQPPSEFEGKWQQKAVQFLEGFKRSVDPKKVLIAEVNVSRSMVVCQHNDCPTFNLSACYYNVLCTNSFLDLFYGE